MKTSLLEKLRDNANMQMVIATKAGRDLLHNQAAWLETCIADMETRLAQAKEELRLTREWLGEVAA